MKARNWQLKRYVLKRLVLPYMVALSYYRIIRLWKILFQKTCHKFFAIDSFALLPSSHFSLHVCFRLFRQTTITERLSLIRKEKHYMWKMWCPNYKKQFCAPQEEVISWNIVLYPLSQFSTKSQSDQKYHNAKKHSASNPLYTFKCNICYQEFPGFNALHQQKNTQHGKQTDQEQEMWMWNT